MRRVERAGDLVWLPNGEGLTCISFDERFFALSLAGGTRTLWSDSQLPPHQDPMLGHYSPDG